jgi:hypothetical protein
MNELVAQRKSENKRNTKDPGFDMGKLKTYFIHKIINEFRINPPVLMLHLQVLSKRLNCQIDVVEYFSK